MKKYFNSVANSLGVPVAGVEVLVKNYPAGTNATIYSDNGVTPAANPILTNSAGYFEFYAADGSYTLSISGEGVVSAEISDVSLFDYDDANTWPGAQTFEGAVTFEGVVAFDGGVSYSGGMTINGQITSLVASGTPPFVVASTTEVANLRAATATALATARTIGGVSFDGTANITVASATGGFSVSGGNLTVTGKYSGQGLAASPFDVFGATGSTTAQAYGGITNTGGSLRFGVESSAGGTLATGTTAYASLIGTTNSTPFHLIANGAVVGTVSSTGLAITGTMSATGTIDAGSNVSITSNGTSFQWTSAGNNVAMNATSGSLFFYTGTSGYVNNMTLSPAGLAVTGVISAVSATNQAIFEGGTQGAITIRKTGIAGFSWYNSGANAFSLFDNDATVNRVVFNGASMAVIGSISQQASGQTTAAQLSNLTDFPGFSVLTFNGLRTALTYQGILGGGGNPSLFYNVDTTGAHIIRVAGADIFYIDATRATFQPSTVAVPLGFTSLSDAALYPALAFGSTRTTAGISGIYGIGTSVFYNAPSTHGHWFRIATAEILTLSAASAVSYVPIQSAQYVQSWGAGSDVVGAGPNLNVGPSAGIGHALWQLPASNYGMDAWTYNGSVWTKVMQLRNTVVTIPITTGNVLNLGADTSLSTATPLNMSLGGTLGNNTQGTEGNLKLKLYKNSADAYGIGISSSTIEYQASNAAAASGASHLFFINGVAKVNMTTSAVTLGSGVNLVVAAGQGIDFSATSNGGGTTTSEVLSDYEEGTFTPSITFAVPGDLSVTYSYQVGRYTKVGNRVHFSISILTASFTHTTASGVLTVAGLPFVSNGAASNFPMFATGYGGLTLGTYETVVSYIGAGVNAAYVAMSDNSGGVLTNLLAAQTTSGANVGLYITGTYEV